MTRSSARFLFCGLCACHNAVPSPGERPAEELASTPTLTAGAATSDPSVGPVESASSQAPAPSARSAPLAFVVRIGQATIVRGLGSGKEHGGVAAFAQTKLEDLEVCFAADGTHPKSPAEVRDLGGHWKAAYRLDIDMTGRFTRVEVVPANRYRVAPKLDECITAALSAGSLPSQKGALTIVLTIVVDPAGG